MSTPPSPAAPPPPTDTDAALNGRNLHAIFQLWEEKHSTPGYDPVNVLTRYKVI